MVVGKYQMHEMPSFPTLLGDTMYTVGHPGMKGVIKSPNVIGEMILRRGSVTTSSRSRIVSCSPNASHLWVPCKKCTGSRTFGTKTALSRRFSEVRGSATLLSIGEWFSWKYFWITCNNRQTFHEATDLCLRGMKVDDAKLRIGMRIIGRSRMKKKSWRLQWFGKLPVRD